MQRPALASALESACIRHGARIALTGSGVTLSFGSLREQASDLAATLAAYPVAGQPVIVRCSNHPSDVVAFLGVWLAGGLVAPVHRTAPAEVVGTIQAKAQCPLAIDLLAGVEARESNTPDIAGPGNRVPTDRAPAPPLPTMIQPLPVERIDHSVRQRMLAGGALVIFTSGSTGLPKGVVLSHDAFYGKLEQNQRVFQAGPDTSTLLVLNDTFSFGIWVALMTLMQGGRVTMLERFTPRTFVDALCLERISFTAVIPTMMRATFASLTPDALSQAKADIAALGRLHQVVIGGESLGRHLSSELRAFVAPAKLFDVYGLTETSTSDFMLSPDDHAAHPGSIGRPFPGIRHRVVDSEGRVCGPGVVGELQLATPYIMTGYLGDPDLTEQGFSAEWFKTGDLATDTEDGFVSVVGRLKELIVRGGNKITPLEVELALLKCEGVANALVAGVPDAIMGQRIHALLVARPGARLSERGIREALAAHLEKFKAPDAYYLGDELPTGRTGKIDRGQLQKQLSAGTLTPLAG